METCQKKKKKSKRRTPKKQIQKHERKNNPSEYEAANFLYSIKMSGKTLKFDNTEVNKTEFHNSKQAIDLNSVDIKKVTSDKFKPSDKGFKYFFGCKDDNIVRPLCIILPQMSGYIKYFENEGKNMSFMTDDDSILLKYNEIWNKIKKTLSI